jgi:predicted RNase H-like HicB family nuclease
MFGLKKKHKISFDILICVEKDDDSYHAFVPNLKGIHVDGSTEQEAIENAKKACVLYIKSLIAHDEPIPLQQVRAEEVCSPTLGMMLACPVPQRETIYVNA